MSRPLPDDQLTARHRARLPLTRRQALRTMGAGFGMTAFAQMVSASMQDPSRSLSSAGQDVLRRPQFAPRAKNVIFLFMNGGVSQVDTFDPKPELAKYDRPVLILHGASDPFGRGTFEAVVKAFPNATGGYEYLEKCGHIPWEECSERFWSLTIGFLGAAER